MTVHLTDMQIIHLLFLMEQRFLHYQIIPTAFFQLDEYQKELGKAYNRITLYLLKRSDQENYNNLQESASDSGSDTDEGSIRQMTITESFAKVTNLTNDTMVQDTISIDDTVMQATVDQ